MAAGVPDYYHVQRSVTVPAGTALAAPISVDISPGLKVLESIEVRIPPGPNGQAGFRIEWTGTPLVPWGNAGEWIVGNNEPISFPLGLEVDQGVVFKGYNTDVYDHTFYVRMTVRDITPAPIGAVAPLPLQAINDAAGGMSP